jgi:heptosyltransferase-2
MALPVLDALARTDGTLAVLARAHLAPLLTLVPAVAEVIERSSSNDVTIDRIRKLSCDESIILPNSFRAAWLVLRARVPIRWGYRGDWRAPLLKPAVRRQRRAGHQVEDYDQLLASIGAPIPEAHDPRLELSPAAAETAAVALDRAGLDREDRRPLIGLFAGAEFGPAKRWPLDRFGEVARRLRRLDSGARLLLIAGPKEVSLAVDLHTMTNRLAPVVGPNLDLAVLAGVLAALDLLVTNDSGPMHLAAAVGTPSVALFGPSDPRRTSPRGPGHQVLYTHRWCSPCFRRRCPLFHQRCLKEIDVGEVERACRDAIGVIQANPD